MGLAKLLPLERPEPLGHSGLSMDVAGDQDAEIFGETDGSAVEPLVVERAKGEPVLRDTGPAGLVPFDMRRIQGQVPLVDLGVVAAYGTSVLISVDDGLTKCRVSLWLRQIRGQSDFARDVFVKGRCRDAT